MAEPTKTPQVIPYRSPKANVGATVLWFTQPGGEPYPGFVTAVGQDTLNVTVWGDGSRIGQPKTAVRHVTDPVLLKLQNPEAGCWDYTNDFKAFTKAIFAK